MIFFRQVKFLFFFFSIIFFKEKNTHTNFCVCVFLHLWRFRLLKKYNEYNVYHSYDECYTYNNDYDYDISHIIQLYKEYNKYRIYDQYDSQLIDFIKRQVDDIIQVDNNLAI